MISSETTTGVYRIRDRKDNYLSMSTSPPLRYRQRAMSMNGLLKECLRLPMRRERYMT